MKRLFSFPQYTVDKNLGRKRYLSFANLSPAERTRLRRKLDDIQVDYVLPCVDGEEIVFMNAKINDLTSHGMSAIADAICSSLPYAAVVLLWSGDHGKIYVTKSQKSKSNVGRRRIDNKISSYLFRLSNPDEYMWWALHVIQSTEVPIADPKEVIQDWFRAIDYSRDRAENQTSYTMNDISFEDDESDQVERSFAYTREDDDFDYDEDGVYPKQQVLDALRSYAGTLYREFAYEIEGEVVGDVYTLWAQAYVSACEEIVRFKAEDSLTYSDQEYILAGVLDSAREVYSVEPVIEIDEVRKQLFPSL